MAVNQGLGNIIGYNLELGFNEVKSFLANKSIEDQSVSALGHELMALEGINTQNPETGAGLNSDTKTSYLKYYTNRIFGAPYQLLDSVDRRFPEINEELGSEYLRNIILNSPILHIKPGMPKYTGDNGGNKLTDKIKYLYMDTNMGDMSVMESLIMSLGQKTIFSAGSKLQRRMFGFRETYYDYMSHVNYMCRSVAIFLNLTTGEKFPNGIFTSVGYKEFSVMKWENYRMMGNSVAKTPMQYTKDLIGAVVDGPVELVKDIGGTALDFAKSILNPLETIQSGFYGEGSLMNKITDAATKWVKNFSEGEYSGELIGEKIANKICSVEFMVNPFSSNENLHNETVTSVLEQGVDSLNSIGSEIRFITNSRADTGMIEKLTSFLGNAEQTATQFLTGVVNATTGGFTANLFSGALQSLKGQKMIYPKIYKSSTSSMDNEFSMTLTTPYGDPYNYFINIIVPLLHLIALTAPRMVTANTTTSPYLIQAYIPGQYTCQLGIIRDLTIRKNPNQKHVSVNGFPLTVEVTFSIEELYNAMSISPANDPSSFLFNETLNDYMANLAGLIPSIDTYTKQRKEMLRQAQDYITDGEIFNEGLEPVIEKFENFVNPFSGR